MRAFFRGIDDVHGAQRLAARVLPMRVPSATRGDDENDGPECAVNADGERHIRTLARYTMGCA